jgi:CRISPR-associated protein Csy3
MTLKLKWILKSQSAKSRCLCFAEHQDTLKVAFTLKVLGGIEQPSACNNETFLNSYKEVAKNYIQTHGFTELAKRYALNIANARFLWRNRVGAEKIEVVVTVNDQDSVTFNAFDYKLHDFDSVDAKVQNLADQIANALKGELPYLLIKVEAYALVGKAQEVYPSEELVLDKGKGDKSKILYQVNDVAAMHSQKLAMHYVPLIRGIQILKSKNQPLQLNLMVRLQTWAKPIAHLKLNKISLAYLINML